MWKKRARDSIRRQAYFLQLYNPKERNVLLQIKKKKKATILFDQPFRAR